MRAGRPDGPFGAGRASSADTMPPPPHPPSVGAHPHGRGVSFRYWAPERSSLTIVTEEGRRLSLTREGPFFTGLLSDAGPGLRHWLPRVVVGMILDPLRRSQL